MGTRLGRIQKGLKAALSVMEDTRGYLSFNSAHRFSSSATQRHPGLNHHCWRVATPGRHRVHRCAGFQWTALIQRKLTQHSHSERSPPRTAPTVRWAHPTRESPRTHALAHGAAPGGMRTPRGPLSNTERKGFLREALAVLSHDKVGGVGEAAEHDSKNLIWVRGPAEGNHRPGIAGA